MEKAENTIRDLLNNKYKYRSCVILIKGPHGSGKTYILNKLINKFSKYNAKLINFNKYYLEKISNDTKKKSKLEILRELIDDINKKNQYIIIAIDNLEEFYNRLKPNKVKELLLTCIHKSRQYKIKNRHIIIILTLPTSEKLYNLENVINSLDNKIRDSITLIDL